MAFVTAALKGLRPGDLPSPAPAVITHHARLLERYLASLIYALLFSSAPVVDIVELSKNVLGIASAMAEASMSTTNGYKKQSPVYGFVCIAVADVIWSRSSAWVDLSSWCG